MDKRRPEVEALITAVQWGVRSGRRSTLKDVEFAGPHGRAVVRFAGTFHSVVWRSPDESEVGAKIFPAYEEGSEPAAIQAALEFVHYNLRPSAGSRSYRRITRRGLQPVS